MTVLDDLRHAARRLIAQPGSLALATAMLAVAIGITAAMFTIVDALMLRPVPFPEADRLATGHIATQNSYLRGVGFDLLRGWRNSPAFDAVHAASPDSAIVETHEGLQSLPSAWVTPGVFEMLGVRPIAGRLFVAGEGRSGADDRVVISETIWRVQFAGAADIIGRRVRLNGAPVEVVGVLPASFRFPSWRTTLWRPIDLDSPLPSQATWRPTAFVRRSAAMPESDAAARAAAVMHQTDPKLAENRVIFRPLTANFVDPYSRRAIGALAGGVALVFLALAANVANLLLARMSARRREFGVCAALGASRGRLFREALIEAALLGVAGSAIGLIVGAGLVGLARQYLPEAFLLRTLNPVDLDLRAVAVAALLGVVATTIAGVVPAWLATRARAGDALRPGDRGGTETRAQRTLSRGLLIAEMAMATALLIGAGVLARSFVNLTRVDRGLDPRGVVSGYVSLPDFAFADQPSRLAAADAIERELRSLPVVRELTLSYGAPAIGADLYFGKWQSDDAGVAPVALDISAYAVDDAFFRLYRIPILEGRSFAPDDGGSQVIVSEGLARRLWPGRSAIGRSFGQAAGSEYHVIGVAREIHSQTADPLADGPEIYRPLRTGTLAANGRREATRLGGGLVYFSVRCGDGGCGDLSAMRARIRAAHPATVVSKIGALDAVYLEELARPRAAAALGVAFALIATLASAGGLFSVLTYAVGRRRREFGIRAALGARPADLGRLVLKYGLQVAAAGLLIGIGAALALSRVLASLEYGVSAGNPSIWTAVVALLFVTALAAAWAPARAAARVDPVRLLRES